jgi:hypothetical protein
MSFGIEPGDGPPFREQWLNSRAAQQFQCLNGLVFANSSLDRFGAIGLFECTRRVSG